MKHTTLILALALAGCSSAGPASTPGVMAPEQAVAPETMPETSSEPTAGAESHTSEDLARPAVVAIDARVADARERLARTDAGRLVWSAIEAHGGLQRWYANGPIAFRFAYRPVSGKVRDTFQVVDTWSARARHDVRTGPEGTSFGWDGARAWIMPKDVEPPTNVRFWSLTPYYFVGVPFVLADRGVVLKRDGEAELEGKTYDLVRVTFEAGVGDAPEDFYVLYIDRESRRIAALRYIVTYKGFFPDGGHSPEKLMTYDGAQKVDGIVLPTSFRTFTWDGAQLGEKVTNTELSEVAFRPQTPSVFFDVPDGAGVLEGY